MSSDWNPTLVTRDGEKIDPAPHLAGTHGDRQRQPTPSARSDVHAGTLSEDVVEQRTASTDGPFECADCGREYASRGGEADCLRYHARRLAEQLQQQADAGNGVLEVSA